MHAHAEQDLNRAAFSATTHCLTGCAIGEVLGMAIATAAGWGNLASIVLAIAFGPAWAVNRWLIARGKGHVVAHQYRH